MEVKLRGDMSRLGGANGVHGVGGGKSMGKTKSVVFYLLSQLISVPFRKTPESLAYHIFLY